MKRDIEKEKDDYLFDSNNMLLNNIWNKQASDKGKVSINNKKKIINVDLTDKRTDSERFIFNTLTIGTMIFPFVAVGILNFKVFKEDSIIAWVLTILAFLFAFAWILEPIFLGTYKVQNIIDDFASKIAKKFR